MLQNVHFSFISLFIPFMDYGLDCNLALSYYYNWDDIKTGFNCPNSTLINTGNYIGCNVANLDPGLVKWYSIAVLIATHLFQCIILTLQWVAFRPMLYSIISVCCVNTKLGIGKLLKLLLVTALVAICLPFITKIYILLIVSVRCYTFKQNFKRFYDLKSMEHQYKSQFPVREPGHGCRACKNCKSITVCFCFKCGFTSENVTANKYGGMVRDLESNAMDLLPTHAHRCLPSCTGAALKPKTRAARRNPPLEPNTHRLVFKEATNCGNGYIWI